MPELETASCKRRNKAGRQWLTPVILTTQEAEVRRIEISPGK
jgi:hypothetical protein